NQSGAECATNLRGHLSKKAQVTRLWRKPLWTLYEVQVMKRPGNGNLIHNPNTNFLRDRTVDAFACVCEIVPGSGQNDCIPALRSSQLRCFRLQFLWRLDTRNVAPCFPRRMRRPDEQRKSQ